MLRAKLGRDLLAVWPRLTLMVVAIAISLTMFGAVLFAWSASGRETGAAYASTAPASATILLDPPVDSAQMSAIVDGARKLPGVIDAVARSQFHSEVRVNGESRQIPMQVYVAAPDDPMRTARIFLAQRAWPPAAGELFVGQDTLALLEVALGDTITVTAPDGQRVHLRVADTVYDPGLSPSPQEQTGRAYISAASLARPESPPRLDQLKIQVAGAGQVTASSDRAEIVAVAAETGRWLQREHGLAVREIQVPKPYAHPHQWQSDALLAALLAGTAAALLLAAMLVASMLNNLFTAQIPQIGIMKAIGARPRHIALLYLTMTLLVASVATLIAVGPAVLLGRLAVKTFLGFLGVQPVSLAPPMWTVVVVLAAGLLLPVLMALIPILKAGRISVRAAIDHHGGAAKPGRAAVLLARLGRFTPLDRGLLMALRNTARRPARFWLSVSLLAVAGTVFVAGMSLSTSTRAISEEQERHRTWDVDVQLAGPAAQEQVAALLQGLAGVSDVGGFTVVPAGLAGPGQIPVTRTYPDQGHGRIAVTAIPADSATVAIPELLEGRWLRPGETGVIVVNQVTRANTLPGLRAGDTVQLLIGGKPTTWRVVGIAAERMAASSVYATDAGLAAAMGVKPAINQLRVVTTSHDEPARQAVASAVSATLSAAGLTVVSADSVLRRQDISEGHLGPVILILLGIALPLGIVGLIGLASAMSANVLDRTREFGVMHAIGARPKAVRRIVMAEGIFLTLTSCLVAIVPALVLTAILGAGLGNLFFSAPLPYRFSVAAAGIWCGLAVLGTLLATEAAASRAARLTVREALAYL